MKTAEYYMHAAKLQEFYVIIGFFRAAWSNKIYFLNIIHRQITICMSIDTPQVVPWPTVVTANLQYINIYVHMNIITGNWVDLPKCPHI